MFKAATRNVYEVPGVRPATTSEVVASAVEMPSCATPLMYGVTRYEPIGAPPSSAGAVQLSRAWPTPAVATTLVGAPGLLVVRATGTVTVTGSVAGPTPAEFTAWTVNVYVWPGVS